MLCLSEWEAVDLDALIDLVWLGVSVAALGRDDDNFVTGRSKCERLLSNAAVERDRSVLDQDQYAPAIALR
jgi:hypothetical protein